MAGFRLSEADRERLGAPEFLPFEQGSLTNREALELRRLGFTTPRQFYAALKLREVKDDDGNVDHETDYLAWTAFVWLALKRAGVKTDVDTLEFNIDDLRYVGDEDPPEREDPGKAPDPDPSTSSETTS